MNDRKQISPKLLAELLDGFAEVHWTEGHGFTDAPGFSCEVASDIYRVLLLDPDLGEPGSTAQKIAQILNNRHK